ncbi:hypothetical protein H2248_006152 [Termitomyces sp. 'cryptogamus']|nr:hypothetical protein H2248_006152 [Termitomyces sp. 'cryptogamus']
MILGCENLSIRQSGSARSDELGLINHGDITECTYLEFVLMKEKPPRRKASLTKDIMAKATAGEVSLTRIERCFILLEESILLSYTLETEWRHHEDPTGY